MQQMLSYKRGYKKSVRLTAEEWKALKKYRRGFHTGVDCAESLNINRLIVERIILIGSGNERSVIQIREFLKTISNGGQENNK